MMSSNLRVVVKPASLGGRIATLARKGITPPAAEGPGT